MSIECVIFDCDGLMIVAKLSSVRIRSDVFIAENYTRRFF